MNYSDSTMFEPFMVQRIVGGLDGHEICIRKEPGTTRIGLPDSGYQGILGFFRDRDVYARITGPFFQRFEQRAARNEFNSTMIVRMDWSVSYEMTIPNATDAVRYEAEVMEFASQHDWNRSWVWHLHELRHREYVRFDQHEYLEWFCGGLPGSHRTVEVPERPIWH